MTEVILWVTRSVLGLIALLSLALLLVAHLVTPRFRARFRHRQYHVTTRGWAARRQSIRMAEAAEGFRNYQARFLSCMRRPRA